MRRLFKLNQQKFNFMTLEINKFLEQNPFMFMTAKASPIQPPRTLYEVTFYRFLYGHNRKWLANSCYRFLLCHNSKWLANSCYRLLYACNSKWLTHFCYQFSYVHNRKWLNQLIFPFSTTQVYTKTETRRKVGRILLKGDNITLIQQAKLE